MKKIDETIIISVEQYSGKKLQLNLKGRVRQKSQKLKSGGTLI